jgi:ribosomal protein S18 acetylase RimI-like enzyme
MLTFRHGTRDDVPKLVELIESAYRGEESRLGWTTEADFLDGRRTDEDALHQIHAEPESVFLVAFDGDDLVGCCNLRREGDHAHFGMFAVRPRSQDQGIGKALLSEAEITVTTLWHLKQVVLDVIGLRTSLIAWYERRGFHLTGSTRPFPYDNSRFGVPKRDDLVFFEMAKEL